LSKHNLLQHTLVVAAGLSLLPVTLFICLSVLTLKILFAQGRKKLAQTHMPSRVGVTAPMAVAILSTWVPFLLAPEKLLVRIQQMKLELLLVNMNH